MARFDVDSSPVTYEPSGVFHDDTARNDLHSGGATRPAWIYCYLTFGDGAGETLAAAYEEWRAFDTGALRTIVLPPVTDVIGGDVTYSDVFIEIIEPPKYTSVNVGLFTVRVGPIDIS